MAMGRFDSARAQAPMAEINTTPLVDVTLVLLIIFIITAPLMTHSVQAELPRASSVPTLETPAALPVAIDAQGRLYLENALIRNEDLERRFHASARQDPKAKLHLQMDRHARYEVVAETRAAARRAGLTRIGFVTQPQAKAN